MRIGFGVVQLFDRPRVSEQGRLRLVQLTGQVQAPHLLHNGVPIAVRDPRQIGEVWLVVADVLKAAVAHGPHHVVRHVVPVPARVYELPRRLGLAAQKRPALYMGGHFDSCEREHRRAKINRAYQVLAHPPRFHARAADDQRHVDARVVRPALAARQRAVIAPVKDVRIIGQAVFVELLQELGKLSVAALNVRVHPRHGLAH